MKEARTISGAFKWRPSTLAVALSAAAFFAMTSEAHAGHWELKTPDVYGGRTPADEAAYQQKWVDYFSGNVTLTNSWTQTDTQTSTTTFWKAEHGGSFVHHATGAAGGVASIAINGKWRWKLLWKRDDPTLSPPDPDDAPTPYIYV